jgi:hypothetical protein
MLELSKFKRAQKIEFSNVQPGGARLRKSQSLTSLTTVMLIGSLQIFCEQFAL